MIIFCHLFNDYSGSPKVLRSTIMELKDKYPGMIFVGSQGRGALEQTGVMTHRYWYRRSRFKLITLFTYIISQFSLYIALSRTKKIPKSAVIYVNTLLPFGAMLWGWFNRHRVIVHLHEVSITPLPLKFFLTRLAALTADLLIYVSNDHCNRLPIPGPRSKIIYNPVDTDFTGSVTKRVKPIDNEFRVLMLASLKSYKGINEFTDLAKSMQYRPDIRFSLVLNAEQSLVDKFCKTQKVIENLTVFTRADDPTKFYMNADLVLNLSRVDQWIETFGLTVVEAMSFGIPVIVPPIGGPSEIVRDEIDGYHVDSRDKALLKTKLLTLVDNRKIYKKMVYHTHKRAKQFSIKAYSVSLNKILASFLKETSK